MDQNLCLVTLPFVTQPIASYIVYSLIAYCEGAHGPSMLLVQLQRIEILYFDYGIVLL